MGHNARTLIWFRDDLRVSDQPALAAAIARGQPVIALYVLNTMGDTRAPWRRVPLETPWRTAQSAGRAGNPEYPACFAGRRRCGRRSKASFRRNGSDAVFWSRRYAPDAVAQDKAIMARLKSLGTTVESFNSKLLAEPWTVKTGAGGSFKVFTPFCRAARARHSDLRPRPAPDAAIPWDTPPDLGDDLESWGLTPASPAWTEPDWTEGLAASMARWGSCGEGANAGVPGGWL